MQTKNEPNGQKRPSFIETARRAQIIECTIETVAALGYAQTSLARIAERAGISKGVILYYFKSKARLLEQVVSAIYTEAVQTVAPQIAAQPTAARRLQVYISSAVEYIGSHRTQMLALVEIANNSRTQDGRPRYTIAWQGPILADLEALLRQGQKEGNFRSFDPRVMAVTIRRAIDVVPSLIAANPDLDVESYAREVVTLFDRATRKE